MKKLLLFILPILLVVTAVLVIFGIIQAKSEEQKLMDELQRKAKSVAESVEVSARYAIKNKDMTLACRIVDSFQKRERLQGCAIYDANGMILAITQRFADWKSQNPAYFKKISASGTYKESRQKHGKASFYIYVLPVIDEDEKALGSVEVIYDTSYIFPSISELWKRVAIALSALVVLIGLILFLLQRHIFTLPVYKLIEWFVRFQKGEIDLPHPISDRGELGKLASEVEQVALNLRIARKAASVKASERLEQNDLWNEQKLRDFIQAKVGENAFFVVSNREPYMHVGKQGVGTVECLRPAGGVVTALDPILKACGGTWVAHGSGNMDRKFVNSKDKLGVPPEDKSYILRRVWLSKEEEEGYYYGFSNEGLWPLCHNTHTRPIFKESDWQAYQAANEKFADAVLEEFSGKDPFVFIQDYHFTLLPRIIKRKRPDATVALFWHIPWPNPEIFAICPFYKQILNGMLGCDLIGFHVQYHCNNFLDTANRLLECRVDTERFSIVRSEKETFVRAFPISIDSCTNDNAAVEAESLELIKKEFALEGKVVGIGVERIDYTKGIKERVMAIDRFLEKNPAYKHKFVFVQLGAPSRTHIKSYHDLIAEIDELIEKVNWKHSDGNWKPIIYQKRHFSMAEILPYYTIADFCIVSSLHDGMNLVAKEYVSAKCDNNGSLILSRFTGAARELEDAIQINPYATEEFADAIKLAVEMNPDEKRRRMQNMRKAVKDNNVYRWAASIISELTGIKKG